MGVGSRATSIAPPAYVGPGDIVPGAIVWSGSRAYSAAVAATGTQKAYNVRRASDNATQDILILTSGALDIASALTFAGTDVTGNATSSGTTVALTGLASTAHVGDTITGTGYAGTYILSVGALVAGAQTVTTNTSQTIGVAAPVTLTWGLYITTRYDQTGNGNNFVQATAANQAILLPTGSPNGLPRVTYSGNQWELMGGLSAPEPFTISSVAITTDSTNTPIFGFSNQFNIQFRFNGSNTFYIYDAGLFISATCVDGSWHALQGVYNGGSSIANVDGTGTSGTLTGNALGSSFSIGAAFTTVPVVPLNGSINEFGIWPVAFSAGNNTAMSANQHTYWGF